jgi:hydrogenase maturation protease
MTILVIGYGNSLRSDDGAGQYVAQKVAVWDRPLVMTQTAYQLNPDMVGAIIEASIVVFVSVVPVQPADPTSLQVQSLSPLSADRAWGHDYSPAMLLTIAQQLYATVPKKSYWFQIRGENFEFGERFSSLTQQGIQQALTQLSELIRSYSAKRKLAPTNP